MIQRHTILLNPSLTASTESNSASTLTVVNGYEISNVQGLGGGITNQTNIKAFLFEGLNGGLNDVIVNDFYSYMTGATTASEYAEIFSSDQKLSTVFNDFYVESVLNNQAPSSAVLNESLSGTSTIFVSDNQIHVMDGVSPPKGLQNIPLSINDSTRRVNVKEMLTTFTEEESYYIPVFIKSNSKQMARLTFDACDKIINSLLSPPIPTTPVLISGPGKNSTTIEITWGIVDDATSYEIYIANISSGPFILYSTVNSNIGLTQKEAIPGLTAGTTYYFYIIGKNSAGVSEKSNEVSYAL